MCIKTSVQGKMQICASRQTYHSNDVDVNVKKFQTRIVGSYELHMHVFCPQNGIFLSKEKVYLAPQWSPGVTYFSFAIFMWLNAPSHENIYQIVP